MKDKEMTNRLFAVDVSGSMWNFVENARKHLVIGDTVICFDTNVFNVVKMQTAYDIGSYEFRCGGGTDIEAVKDYARKNDFTNVVVFTDEVYFGGNTPNHWRIINPQGRRR